MKNQFKIANKNDVNINEYIVFVVFWADMQRHLIGAYQSSQESTVNANNKTILALTEIPNGDSEFEAPNVYIQDTITFIVLEILYQNVESPVRCFNNQGRPIDSERFLG